VASALPPPIPLEAIPEISAPTAAPSGPAKRLSVDRGVEAPSATGAGRGRFVALALVAAAALGGALFVRSQRAPAAPPPPPAPVEMAVAVPPEVVAPPAAPEQPAHVEIGLDPAAAATPPVAGEEEKARDEKPEHEKPDDEQPADEKPRPARRERPAAPSADDRSAIARGNALLKDGDATGAIAAFAEAIRQAPEAPEGYRGLGLAHEKRGNTAEAMDAFKSYIKLATRSRDREWAARHMYTLAHPDEE
jgi:tetratricopeptide (TPR) repeat protein